MGAIRPVGSPLIRGAHATVVPNNAPTAAVTAIARAPQNVTRAAPTIVDAPPTGRTPESN
jgi:hypothetical protein